MSKRIYKLSAAELGEALSEYMVGKFPELQDMDGADIKLKLNRRTGEITVEIG